MYALPGNAVAQTLAQLPQWQTVSPVRLNQGSAFADELLMRHVHEWATLSQT